MPLFEVSTVEIFRKKYIVEGESLEHAYDEVVCMESDTKFQEFTQRFLGSQISDGREITKKEFEDMLKTVEHDKYENSSFWLGEKLINKIDYTE